MSKFLKVFLFFMLLTGGLFAEDNQPISIEITEGVIEKMPIALPDFSSGSGAGTKLAQKITNVIAQDLIGTGLFREIPSAAYIESVSDFSAPILFSNWKAINAQALLTGRVEINGDNLKVKFRLHDIYSETTLGKGLEFEAGKKSWRRMGHKIADVVYARLTGEAGYFDSRVVYIAEEGSKGSRRKRLAIMDYDGANNRYLTDGNSIVLAPRFSPNAREVVYTSYKTGKPTVFLMNVDTMEERALDNQSGMTFAPRFSPDGTKIVMSLSERGNTDIYVSDLFSGKKRRLTSSPAIETGPSFSPDGNEIVFESDESSGQQIYIMSADGGLPRRISSGKGRYGTPVWSPRGDLIAFTKMVDGKFHIGVMRIDGSREKLLTKSFLDEGPTWAANGRVIMFFRETPGVSGRASLYSVDITGRNLTKVKTPTSGSDPAWSGLLK